jgi:hypothetical protein
VTLDDLIPTWPPNYDRWEAMIALLIIAVLKIVRGTIMKRRSTSVDRLGWSIILWDWVFATAATLQVFWTLYPGTLLSPWFTRVNTGAIAVFALWQLYEVLVAQSDRVDRAVSGTTNGAWQPDDADRRHTYRRAEDRALRGIN